MASKEPRDYRERKQGSLSKIISGTFSLIIFLILTLVLNIAVEWIGIFTWWSDQGANHSIDMFQSEMENANGSIRSSFLSGAPQELLVTSLAGLDRIGQGAMGILGLANYELDIAKELIISAIYITKTFLARLHLLVFAAPLIVLLFWYSAVDGLVERELRKFGGARESNVIFDFSSKWAFWAIIFSGFVYLTSPISLNPALVLLPGCAIFFLFSRTMFASYKKHI